MRYLPLKSSIWAILIFLSCFHTSNAQEPLNVNIALTPPYPNYADEVVNLGSQTIITVQNTDFNASYSIKLGVELSGTNGIIVRTKENALPNQALQMGPGETLVLTGDDLSSFYNNYTENDFDFIGISTQDVINDQQLPDGTYTICIRAYDYNTGIPLSPSSPQGCTAPFSVIAIDPPILTNPNNQAQVIPVEPQLLNINWIPVTVALPDLRYRLEMVDLTDLPMNPYDAFLTDDFLFFSEEGIIGSSFFYGMEHPLLTVGHQYAIRIRAYREDGLLNVNNEGYSDIVVFNYGEVEEEDSETEIVFDSGSLAQQSLDCGSDCQYVLGQNAINNLREPSVGDLVDIGHFQMKISTISGAGTYNGTGVIQSTTYIPVGIKVNFSDLQVNGNNRVVAGEAEAVIRENSWIDHTWADLETEAQNINVSDYGGAFDAATDENFYIDNLTTLYENVGTSIPISIGSGDHSLQIVGMHFFPDRSAFNLSYLLSLADDPTGERYLHFMAKDLCITPGGPALSAEEATLKLVKSLRYTFDTSTLLEFKPPSVAKEGTYLIFDCNGFQGIHAEGLVRLDPEVFKPVDSDANVLENDTVIASFQTNFAEWADWVALITFDNETDPNETNSENQFVHNELEDYLIRIENAALDHSINSNAVGMQFPETYSGPTGPDWQGFYIANLNVEMPQWIDVYDSEDSRVEINGEHLIIDSDGLTGEIDANNIMNSGEGALDKWPLTIENISLSFVQNHLDQGIFSGGLKLPVIEEPFNYTVDIQWLDQGTVHTFTFTPLDSYTFPVWFANATIDNNSYLEVITVSTSSTSVFVEANLNGDISFAPVIGDIDKNNLTGITFENMIIRSSKSPSYIEIGEIGTGLSAQSLAVAGFGVIIDKLEWEEETLSKAGLALGLGLNLVGGSNSISGGTELFIENEIENYADSVNFEFEGTSVESIYIQAETGAVNLEGSVTFFKDDEEFGDGFEGSLELAFIETIKLDGSVLFGSTEVGEEETNYWYAFAMAYLPQSPVPMATPLDIYGFGGGLYYNMAINTDVENIPPTGGSMVDPRDVFVIQPGIAGIQASVVTALTPSSRTFNADVTLTAEINLNTGGLNLIMLQGNGYVMQDLEETDKEQAMVFASVSIYYDFPQETFAAQFGVVGNIPKDAPLLTVSGDISFYRSPTLWYFKAGIPTDKLTTTIDLGFAGINAGAYFMTGEQLPPPVLPSQVNNFFQFESNLINNTQNGLGIGFMAGVHLDMNIDFTALGTGLEITAMAGVDIAVLNYYAATCNGSEDFGVNKWYAQGQGYIYGSFVLSAFSADVGSLELGIIVEGAFPNPTGVSGMVKAEAEFLVFETSVEETFTIGSFCDIQPMEDAEELIERKELELENLDLIGLVTPGSGVNNASLTVRPTIQWFQDDMSYKRYIYGDGLGGIIDKLYRFRNEEEWLKQSGNSWVPVNYDEEFDNEDNISTLIATNANGNPSLLNGNSTYKVRAHSYIEYFDGSPENYFSVSGYGSPSDWMPATYQVEESDNLGDPIEEIVEKVFSTTTSLTEIEELFVDYTLPYPRQRFYPYGYLNTGEIDFNVDHEPKFQDFEDCGFEIQAEFTEANGGGATQVVDVTRETLMQIEFDMALLQPETIYKLEIIAQREISQTDLANEQNENCQVNDEQTLDDILENSGLSVNLGNFNNYAGQVFDMSNVSGQSSNAVNTDLVNQIQGSVESMTVQRKKLYTIYFRTSKYATPNEKLNSMSVESVDLTGFTIYSFPNFITLQDARIAFSCGEGFDKYDIEGHDYMTNETMEYFRVSGPGCNTSGMSEPVQDWYNLVCYQLFSFGTSPGGGMNGGIPNDNFLNAVQSAQAAADAQPQLWETEYAPDPSNYTGIRHIKPLLSDAELGLAEPESEGVFFPGLLSSGGGNESGSGSGGGTGFGLYGGFTQSGTTGNINLSNLNSQYSNTGVNLIGFASGPELEIIYKPETRAYNMLNFLQSGPYNLDNNIEHTPPPAGIYPIRIALSNTNYNATGGNSSNQSRTFNVNIPF